LNTKLQENSGYKEALLLPFEQDDLWDKLNTPASINPKKQKVPWYFAILSSPSFKLQQTKSTLRSNASTNLTCIIFQSQIQVCVDMGACEIEQFEFVTEPLDYTQEQWDDKCYVCQAFAKELEVCAVVSI